MMFRLIIITFLLVLFLQSSFADNAIGTNSHRLAVQGAIATGGNLSIGLVDYSEKTEVGVTISGTVNNASRHTKTATPVVFAGLRKALCERTYFAYGINFADTLGEYHGKHIDADYTVGPYISLEQMLTTNIMLSGWIEPYEFEYEKIHHSSLSTHNFFNAGGIAINYLF